MSRYTRLADVRRSVRNPSPDVVLSWDTPRVQRTSAPVVEHQPLSAVAGAKS